MPKTCMGLLNISLKQPIEAPDEPRMVSGRECSKKHALSLTEGSLQPCPEPCRRKGRSRFDERSVLIVREHGKRATCLREAASAGMEPLACQPLLERRLAAFFNLPCMTLFILLLSAGWFTQDAQAKFGWADADIVLDFGVDVEPGERLVIIDQAEVGYPFHVDVVWRLHPKDCLIQILHDQDGDGTPEWQTVSDDQLFYGNPRHAIASHIEALAVTTNEGKPCYMDPQNDEFLVVSEIQNLEEKNIAKTSSVSLGAPLGATVMILRATSFFTPQVVRIHAGERIVWIYADGAKEPHTARSGACRGIDCTGGGKKFDSGETLNKAGHRFEHIFKHPGTFPYHCALHTASMVGTIIVKP